MLNEYSPSPCLVIPSGRWGSFSTLVYNVVHIYYDDDVDMKVHEYDDDVDMKEHEYDDDDSKMIMLMMIVGWHKCWW